MRIKATDVSYTVSEIPQNHTEQNITITDMYQQSPNDSFHKSQSKHSSRSKSSHSEKHYEMKPFKRPKSSLVPGRMTFKGRLNCLEDFDREKSAKKGQKMSKITSLIRESQDKIQLLKSRLNTLKRQEEKSFQRVHKLEKTKSTLVINRQNLDHTVEKRTIINEKKKIELEEMKIRIAEMKKANEESRMKMRADIEIKQKMSREKNQKINSQYKAELEIKAKKEAEEKKAFIQKIKKEKKEALDVRKSQEREFIEHIQYQYHIDRKTKREEMQKYEEEIKALEMQEGVLIDTLHKTLAWEQQTAIEFQKSADIQAYQTPLITQKLLQQSQTSLKKLKTKPKQNLSAMKKDQSIKNIKLDLSQNAKTKKKDEQRTSTQKASQRKQLTPEPFKSQRGTKQDNDLLKKIEKYIVGKTDHQKQDTMINCSKSEFNSERKEIVKTNFLNLKPVRKAANKLKSKKDTLGNKSNFGEEEKHKNKSFTIASSQSQSSFGTRNEVFQSVADQISQSTKKGKANQLYKKVEEGQSQQMQRNFSFSMKSNSNNTSPYQSDLKAKPYKGVIKVYKKEDLEEALRIQQKMDEDIQQAMLRNSKSQLNISELKNYHNQDMQRQNKNHNDSSNVIQQQQLSSNRSPAKQVR